MVAFMLILMMQKQSTLGVFPVEWDQGIEISNIHNVSDVTKFPVTVSAIKYEHC